MPTEHACQSAAELAAQHLDSLRPFLQPGHPQGEGTGGIGEWPLGASVLLVVLAGLQADRPGELTHWHACAGDRIREALVLPAGTEGLRPGRQPRGWEALALLQQKAQELLTDLANGSSLGRPGELSRQLALVEDAFAGVLRRMAVPGRQQRDALLRLRRLPVHRSAWARPRPRPRHPATVHLRPRPSRPRSLLSHPT